MAAGKVRLTGPSTEFLVRHFSVREALGALFNIELDLLTATRGVKIADLIGQPWTLQIDLPKDKTRYFHGHVANMLSTGPMGRFASYHVTLRPTLWFLSLTSNCRIFPKMSVLDIVQELTNKRGVALDSAGLGGDYPAHRYVVQYRESELDFISRLMEHEGMYYFFKHEDGRHTMMLADGPGAHEAAPGYDEVPFHHARRANAVDHIDQWFYGASVQTKRHALNDYDFKKPNAEILVKLEAAQRGESEPEDFEQYDFPGAFFDAGRGQGLVAIRQQEALANAEVARGAGTVRGIGAGYTFKLKDAPQGQDGEYLVTQASYECTPGDAEASGDDGEEDFFRCAFTAIKKATHYRPPRLTPRPVISSLQSAKVIGPKGKEIWTDEAGRIRIRFHWQRPEEDAAREDMSAIWVRVAQVMAGKGWGALQIPRIGHEVVVSFLDGDPDRPIVTGCVYNESNKPPFDPSAGGMVLGMKSDSTPGGGGYNELSFDDTKGNEKINIHGQYNMETTIEHDETATIKNNRSMTVFANHSENVGGDQMVSVDKNQLVQVGINQTVGVLANQAITVGVNHALTVIGSSTETVGVQKKMTIGGAYAVGIGASMDEKVKGSKDAVIGGDSSEDVTGAKAVSSGKAMALKAGTDAVVTATKKMSLTSGDDLSITGRKKAVINVTDELTIKVGSAQIIMKKNGDISIKGGKISVKGSGDVLTKGSKITQN